jgi:hypothetical protein
MPCMARPREVVGGGKSVLFEGTRISECSLAVFCRSRFAAVSEEEVDRLVIIAVLAMEES